MTIASNFKPMLAGTYKEQKHIKWPIFMSPKLDGIRVLIHPTLGPVTRSLKPIPNAHIRAALNSPEFHYLDGEIIVGGESAEDAFNSTQSAVMRSSGTPEFTYVVFDSFMNPDYPYTKRLQTAAAQVNAFGGTQVKMIRTVIANTFVELLDFEMEVLEEGYEGVMFRQPDGPYKSGRSTERAGTLVKLKQVSDAEAEIIGFEWWNQNDNVATTNALGHTERSSHKAGKTAHVGVIGALRVRGINGDFEGAEFKIGTGMDQAKRLELGQLADWGTLEGKIVSYKYQDVGVKDAPRFPVYKGLRDPDDFAV